MVATVLVGAAIGMLRPQSAEAQQPPRMERWKYLELDLGYANEDKMQKLGRDGWEAYAVTDKNSVQVWFKHRIP